MLLRIISVIAGLFAGFVVVTTFDILSESTHHIPPIENAKNPKDVADFVAKLPVITLIVMTLGWVLSIFTAAYVSGIIYKGPKKSVSITAAALALFATMANVLIIPHPLWMSITTLVLFVPMFMLGIKMAARFNRKSDAPAA